jgi:hypothetical protein
MARTWVAIHTYWSLADPLAAAARTWADLPLAFKYTKKLFPLSRSALDVSGRADFSSARQGACLLHELLVIPPSQASAVLTGGAYRRRNLQSRQHCRVAEIQEKNKFMRRAAVSAIGTTPFARSAAIDVTESPRLAATA